ncbi:mechanosensitive ion channel [Altererythrobacter sp.]|nr:mechanosensitive ion channel [Altererythrobacter sp.]
MIRILIVIAALSLCAAPALAILPAAADSAADPDPAATTSIDDTQDAGADERIADRIEGIFAELPAFENVTVSVSEGVVQLGGMVADDADQTRAESIAGRIEGVVTIENGIERDISVGEGLGVLAELSARVSGWLEYLPLIGLAALVAMAIAAFGYLIAGFSRFWQRVAPNSFLAELIASAIRFIFVVLGVVVGLDMLGAAALLGAVLGGAGVVGIALGFAMRDTVENYVASLMLSLRQPFRANDHVLIDDLEGRVIRLTSRATVLMTLEGNHLRVPNSTVFKAVIINYTRNPQRRFEFLLGVDADDDARAARLLGVETLAGLPFVLGNPGPEARIVEVGDSNVVIQFLAWIDQQKTDFHKAKTRAIPAVKDALEDAGFGLPEPIYRLRFDSRTNPLPFENIGSEQGSTERAKPERKTPPPAPKPPRITDEEDVRPQDEIAQMVDAERSSEGDGNDLLDAGRPVE